MMIGFVFVSLALSMSNGHPTRRSTWPSGQYCLPMPHNEQCPRGWNKGYRHHDTENKNTANQKHNRVPYLSNFGKDIGWGFCCKINYYSWPWSYVLWPKGQYCIFRKGGYCPRGFNKGSMYWDDEDKNNGNSFSGTLPDGKYDKDTLMYFCCRNDGPQVIKTLALPTCHELVLMRYQNACPSMTDYQGPYTGHLEWDSEDSSNKDKKIGVYPDGKTLTSTGIRIEFCSYRSCNSC